MQLTPWQVRKLRHLLLSSKSVEDYQLYLMMLLGIKLFLRADELISIKMEHFPTQFQSINKNAVECIAIKVKGKSDPDWVHLLLYADNDNPEFCPVRHLLVYAQNVGLADTGYLFPEGLDLMKANGRKRGEPFEEHMPYSIFLRKMKKALIKIGIPCDAGKLGTHTLRKTAYLFAIWGCIGYYMFGAGGVVDRSDPLSHVASGASNMCIAMIMLSARHRTIQNASTYIADASTLLGSVAREKGACQAVSRWESIHMVALSNHEDIRAASRIYQRPIAQLSTWYFENVLNLPGEPGPGETPEALCTAITFACRHVPKSSHEEDLLKLVSPEARAAVKALISKVKEDCVRDAAMPIQADTASHPATEAPGPQDGPPAKRQRNEGIKDLPHPGYEEVKNAIKKEKNVRKKVEQFFEAYKTIEEAGGPSQFLEKVRNWYNKGCKWVGNCVVNCHEGSIDAFCDKIQSGGKMFKPTVYYCAKCEEGSRRKAPT